MRVTTAHAGSLRREKEWRIFLFRSFPDRRMGWPVIRNLVCAVGKLRLPLRCVMWLSPTCWSWSRRSCVLGRLRRPDWAASSRRAVGVGGVQHRLHLAPLCLVLVKARLTEENHFHFSQTSKTIHQPVLNLSIKLHLPRASLIFCGSQRHKRSSALPPIQNKHRHKQRQ